ncbi:hypothetical protein RRG08_063467 [Elysia crispata]|uniref:Uncharacterized protein n=1 Tax=Elysia crispata TaxID=231223 RepID=A0AAE1AB67_9GAST|nr:hypothetical protein RRG08_063467 [Elysia crispata]
MIRDLKTRGRSDLNKEATSYLPHRLPSCQHPGAAVTGAAGHRAKCHSIPHRPTTEVRRVGSARRGGLDGEGHGLLMRGY